MKRHPRNNKAFTLIEVLLAISLIALVLTGVYATFWGGISLSKRSQDNNEMFREIRWTLELVANELESMVPYDFSGSYTDKSSCVGKEDKITFLREGKEGLSVVSYYLLKPDAVKRHMVTIGKTYKKNVSGIVRTEIKEDILYTLVREEQGFVDYLAGDAAQEIEILSTHIAADGLSFSFGFSEEGSNVMSYKSSWEKNYNPSNISITLKFLFPGKTNEPFEIKREILIPTGFGGSTETEAAPDESF